MITVKAKLSKSQFRRLCDQIHQRYPSSVGWTQAINECESGLFRLVNVRGGRIPDGLTADVVKAMIASIQAEQVDIHTGALWAGAMNRRYARRMR